MRSKKRSSLFVALLVLALSLYAFFSMLAVHDRIDETNIKDFDPPLDMVTMPEPNQIQAKREEFLASIRALKSLEEISYRSEYQCLGRQNVYEAIQRRSCKFENVCFDKKSKEYLFYQAGKEPVFYDRKRGPIYSFNDGIEHFIQLNAIPYEWNPATYFTPTVVLGEPSTDYAVVNETIVLWATWSHEFNMGHLVFEELASTYIAMKRFRINTQNSKLLNMNGNPSNQVYQKFVSGFSKAISPNPVQGMDSFLSSHSESLVCFKELVVASATRNFISYFDELNYGSEPLWWDFRSDVLKSHDIDPNFVPAQEQIVLIQKSSSLNRPMQGRMHYRDIYNLKDVESFIRRQYPNIRLVVANPAELDITNQLLLFSKTTILITPPGGISMNIPFLPIGSHAIIMDYYGQDEPRLDTVEGESASMEISFWNLFPHIQKHYYQIMDPAIDTIKDHDQALDPREDFSVLVDLQRIEYMINLSLNKQK